MSHGPSVALSRIPPDKRAYDAGRSLVLGWYVARHDEDRYDEVTEYRVALFDAETEEELNVFVTSVHERLDTGVKDGEHLESAAFDPSDQDLVVLRFSDGSERRQRVDAGFEALEGSPEDFGVVLSDAEKRVRELLRQEAEALRRKLKRARKTPQPPQGP